MQENVLLCVSLYAYASIYVDQIWGSGTTRSKDTHISSFGSYGPIALQIHEPIYTSSTNVWECSPAHILANSL